MKSLLALATLVCLLSVVAANWRLIDNFVATAWANVTEHLEKSPPSPAEISFLLILSALGPVMALSSLYLILPRIVGVYLAMFLGVLIPLVALMAGRSLGQSIINHNAAVRLDNPLELALSTATLLVLASMMLGVAIGLGLSSSRERQ